MALARTGTLRYSWLWGWCSCKFAGEEPFAIIIMNSFFLLVDNSEATMRDERRVVASRKRLEQYRENWQRIHLKKLLDISRGRSILRLVLLSGRAGQSLSRVRRSPEGKMLHPTNATHSQFERVLICRETYVCFPSNRAVASALSVKLGINTARTTLNLARSEEERARLRDGRQRPGSDGKSWNRSDHPRVMARSTRTYSFKTYEQTSTESLDWLLPSRAK